MKLGWFWFTAAPDGFDMIVRDQGADNGEIVLDQSVRGESFKKFVDEVLFQGLASLNPPEEKGVPDDTPPSDDSDWHDEPPANIELVEGALVPDESVDEPDPK